MNAPRIRPLSLCVFRRDSMILVSKGYDPKKSETYYRPIGGGIEFGELAENACRREVLEELGTEIENVRKLGVLENIFTFNGKPGHEIVYLYEADFSDARFYDADEHPIVEGGEV